MPIYPENIPFFRNKAVINGAKKLAGEEASRSGQHLDETGDDWVATEPEKGNTLADWKTTDCQIIQNKIADIKSRKADKNN